MVLTHPFLGQSATDQHEVGFVRISKLLEGIQLMISNGTHARILLHVFWVCFCLLGVWGSSPLIANASAHVILKLLVCPSS